MTDAASRFRQRKQQLRQEKTLLIELQDQAGQVAPGLPAAQLNLHIRQVEERIRGLEGELDDLAAQAQAEGWRLAAQQAPGLPPDLLPPAPGELLPAPGPRLPHWRLPFRRNVLFTGRERDLRAVAKALLDGAAPLALAGWGGVGKSQLAVEFAYRYGRFFPGGVFWLNASAADALRADVVQAGLALGLAPWPEQQEAQIAAVLRHWRRSEPCLLVLDNLESVALARDWLAELDDGDLRLLITSRRRSWPRDLGLTVHRLSHLQRAESIALLHKHIAGEQDDEPGAGTALDPIAARLGDLPLALDLAGRYLAGRPGLSPGAYLAELDAAARAPEQGALFQHQSLSDWLGEGSPTAQAASLAASFTLSWQQIDVSVPIDALAAFLFAAAGYCAANERIPRQLFHQLTAASGAKLTAPDVDQALRRLEDLGLVGLDPEGALLHVLVAEFARGQDSAGLDALAALADALAMRALQVVHSGFPARFLPYRLHCRAAAEHAQRHGLPAAAVLWESLGQHLYYVADFGAARAVLEHALALAEAAFGDKSWVLARTANTLGMTLIEYGEFEQATALLHRALDIWLAQDADTESARALVYNNLATIEIRLDRFANASAYLQEALDIWAATSAENENFVALANNNMGMVYQSLGAHAEALQYYEQALEIWRQLYGEDSPQVAMGLNQVGFNLREQGRTAEALPYLEQALDGSIRNLGDEHPQVAYVHNNLGLVYIDLQAPETAEQHLERARVIWTSVHGERHPDVAKALGNLGFLAIQRQDYETARQHFQSVLEIWEEALGPKHHLVALASNNLGEALTGLRRFDEALAAYRRAIETMDEAALPPEHPWRKVFRANAQALEAYLRGGSEGGDIVVNDYTK